MVTKRKAPTTRTSSTLKLEPPRWFLDRNVVMPEYARRNGAIKFEPTEFVTDNDTMQKNIFTEDQQTAGFKLWKTAPMTHPLLRRGVYGIGSAPSDAVALYYAAYLVQVWLKKWEEAKGPARQPVIRWLAFGYDRDYKLGQDILTEGAPCDLVIISNLHPNSSKFRLERARDIIQFRACPTLVVVSGEDPITFFSTKLFASLQACFFHSSKLMKRKVEVI